MSTEEREESQPRPRKVIPSIRRENTDQEGERRPYNQGYNRPEGNNYERRPYDRPSRDDRGGYNSYGDNRSSYGDRPSRPRTYDNREGVITADHLITTVAVMEIIARVVTVTIVKVVTTQIAKVATTAVLLMATIAPLTATMTVRMVVAVPTTVLLVLTMTKDQADLILLRRKVQLLVTA